MSRASGDRASASEPGDGLDVDLEAEIDLDAEVDLDAIAEGATDAQPAKPERTIFDSIPPPMGTVRPLEPGERVLLVDYKQRRYLVRLVTGGEFHTHAGVVPHDHLIGRDEGVRVRSTRGGIFRMVRPTLADFILKMDRGAQVIYPKDLGPLLLLIDVYPGVRVLESGIGSGALSMTLLRAGAEVVGYEIREDFASRARKNVVAMLGEAALERYRIEIRDCYEGIDEEALDRVVLDLPEPWQVVPHALRALRPGGIFVAYTPSIIQAAQVREALSANGFDLAQTLEVLQRTWHIDGAAVRPDHRMVGHTGFLTHARRLS